MKKVNKRKIKLSYYRKLNGFSTQDQMAKLLDISPTSYSFKESGIREFTEKEINKILEVFNVRYEDIFLHDAKQYVKLNDEKEKK